MKYIKLNYLKSLNQKYSELITFKKFNLIYMHVHNAVLLNTLTIFMRGKKGNGVSIIPP